MEAPALPMPGKRSVGPLLPFNQDPEVIEQKTGVRFKRKEILDPKYGAKFRFVLEETVLRRLVGGREVMKAQLEHLRELRQQGNVSISMIPFSAGVHVGVGRGPFVVLEFPGDEHDHVVAVEHSGVGLTLQDDRDQVSDYLEAFVRLEGLVSTSEELDDLLEELIRDLA